MSEVVTGILKLTFGFISKKVRTYGAEKLQAGGLTDQKFRGFIVSELDEIKVNLDALSRRELSASISSLQIGVKRLKMSFGDSTERGDSSKFELPRNEKQSQDTTKDGESTSTQTKPTKKSVAIDDAVALANAIGKLKVASRTRFESARESFKDAGREAKLVFHNAALSTEERILASKVRIASGILEHLGDPEFAANDCLQYLQELHDLPAIQDIFSVHIKAGIKTWLKSGFKKDSRAEIVETVTMINLILADFISRFTKRKMAAFDWPMITCGKRVVHPIHYKKDCFPDLEEMEITPPWDMLKSAEDIRGLVGLWTSSALTTQGDIVFASYSKVGLHKQDKTTGELQPHCLSPSQDKHIRDACGLAVDAEDDTVYVLSGNQKDGYTLSVYSRNGRNTHHCILEFLAGLRCQRAQVAVTKDKNIVVCFDHYEYTIKVWLCDCNGELKNSFVTRQNKYDVLMNVSVSCNNEVMLTCLVVPLFKALHMVRIYTEDGHLQRTVTCRPSDIEKYMTICYNEVTKNIIGCNHFDDRTVVEFFSDQTGELLYSYSLYKTNLVHGSDVPGLVCHRNGTLALVGTNSVLFLRKPSI